jgi:hypothetical protein
MNGDDMLSARTRVTIRGTLVRNSDGLREEHYIYKHFDGDLVTAEKRAEADIEIGYLGGWYFEDFSPVDEDWDMTCDCVVEAINNASS